MARKIRLTESGLRRYINHMITEMSGVDDDREIINSPEDGGTLHEVCLWSGSGYSLSQFFVYADGAEEALYLVVAYIINEGYEGLYITVEDEEEYAQEVINDGDAEDIDSAVEYMNDIYIDATMEGAPYPVYVRGENLRIREVGEMKESRRSRGRMLREQDETVDTRRIVSEFMYWAKNIADTPEGGMWGDALGAMKEYCEHCNKNNRAKILNWLLEGFAIYKGVPQDSLPVKPILYKMWEFLKKSWRNGGEGVKQLNRELYGWDEDDSLTESIARRVIKRILAEEKFESDKYGSIAHFCRKPLEEFGNKGTMFKLGPENLEGIKAILLKKAEKVKAVRETAKLSKYNFCQGIKKSKDIIDIYRIMMNYVFKLDGQSVHKSSSDNSVEWQ